MQLKTINLKFTTNTKLTLTLLTLLSFNINSAQEVIEDKVEAK